ncbi:MAG TPA: hypothetical protein VLI54_06895 [Bacillota bacterium]|nr:hypothetical protein [Bacillota bacterium]
MEYDPLTEKLTVYGPVYARLILAALGVSYANSPEVADPAYMYIVGRDELGPILDTLDSSYLADVKGDGDHAEAQLLSNALYDIIMTPYRSGSPVAGPPSDQVY